MSGMNQIAVVASEAEKLRESVEKSTENNSTMVNEKDALEVLLENQKAE